MIETYIGITTDPATAKAAAEALRDRGAIYVMAGPMTVLLVLDGERLFMGGDKAGKWITRETPANKFELIKGGFRIDIAERLVAVLASLVVSNSVTENVTVVPQLADLSNGDEHG